MPRSSLWGVFGFQANQGLPSASSHSSAAIAVAAERRFPRNADSNAPSDRSRLAVHLAPVARSLARAATRPAVSRAVAASTPSNQASSARYAGPLSRSRRAAAGRLRAALSAGKAPTVVP